MSKQQEINYWLFQSKPAIFQLREALRAGAVFSFPIKQHKSKVKIGDKIILWQTGQQAGVYALATVHSAVGEGKLSIEEALFFKDTPVELPRVQLKVEYNLWNRPITKEAIEQHPTFASFNAGFPGTNFKANEQQYKEIINFIEQYDIVNEPIEEYVVQKSTNYPLNLILYGPPGTGKTFQTINYALAIIENRTLEELRLENRAHLRQRFDTYLEDGLIHFVTFHQSMAYEDFVEGIKARSEDGQIHYEIEDGIFKRICQKAKADLFDQLQSYDLDKEVFDLKTIPHLAQLNLNRHVLIIDEINRANLAAVFGELITLIEPDKREGQAEALQSILPYSKVPFSIPPNLHLLCTMNTADRSTDTIDFALRRRFTFVEVAPQAQLLAQQEGLPIEMGINLQKMLEAINERITYLLDKDHCIGHAFLMNVYTLDDLREAFATKIIPLLQEYFFNNYGKIGLVVGQEFLEEVSSDTQHLFANFDYEYSYELHQKRIYRLRPIHELKEGTFIRIYEKSYEG